METSADVGYNVGTGIDVSVYNTLVTVCAALPGDATGRFGQPSRRLIQPTVIQPTCTGCVHDGCRMSACMHGLTALPHCC